MKISFISSLSLSILLFFATSGSSYSNQSITYDPSIYMKDEASTQKDFSEKRYQKIIDESWNQLIHGKTKDPAITLSTYIKALINLNKERRGVMYFEEIKNQLLDKFPNSPEYRFAIGLVYFQLPGYYELNGANYNRQYSSSIYYLYDLRPDRIAGLRYIHQAFELALKQNNKKLAANYAYMLANALCLDYETYFFGSSKFNYLNLNRLTNLNCTPTPDNTNFIDPLTSAESFTIYQTPSSWKSAKNDAERVLWLMAKAKELDPQQASMPCDLLWAKVISSMFQSNRVNLNKYLSDNQTTTELSKLKINEYSYTGGMLENDDDSEIGKIYNLKGIYDYNQTYQNALAQTPGNLEIATEYANELWNRSKFSEAVEVIKKALAHTSEPKDSIVRCELDKLFHSIISPAIKLRPDYDFRTVHSNIPKDGFKIPVYYHNSPKEKWNVTKIDLSKLTKEQINELSDITSSEAHDKICKEFEPKQIIKDILSKKKSTKKYITHLPDIDLQFNSSKPYQWYEGEMVVPIKEPGIYLISEAQSKQFFIIQISSVSYLFNRSGNGYDFLCFDRTSGKPLTNISCVFDVWLPYKNKFRRHQIKASSDKNGMCHIDIESLKPLGGKKVFLNPMTIGGFVSHEETTIPISPITLDISANQSSSEKAWAKSSMAQGELNKFCIFNQPIYQQGNTVHGKFIVSQYNLTKPRASTLAGTPVIIKVLSSRCDPIELSQTNYYLDEFGTVDFSFNLKDYHPSGSYEIEIDTAELSENISFYHTAYIQVEKFVKPDFETSIISKTDNIEYNKPFTIDFSGSYYSGGPLAQGKVEYALFIKEFYGGWEPAPKWSWMDGSYDDSYSIPSSQGEELTRGEMKLDHNGKASFTFTPNQKTFGTLTENYQRWQYLVKAIFYDESGKSIQSTALFNVSKYPFFINKTLEENFAIEGKNYPITWEATSTSGSRIPNVQGTLHLVQTDPNCELGEQSPNDKILESWDIKFDEHGIAKWNFTPKFAGEYELRGKWQDQQGNISKSASTILIGGNNVLSPFRSNDIILNKDAYTPNEKVKAFITTSNETDYVWLNIRQDWINQTNPIIQTKSGNHLLEIDTTHKDLPNFQISFICLGSSFNWPKTLNVCFPPMDKIVNISAIPNSLIYAPKETGNIQVQVKYPNGAPVKNSQITLTVYDAALDYFNDKAYPSILRKTWGNLNTFNNSSNFEFDCKSDNWMTYSGKDDPYRYPFDFQTHYSRYQALPEFPCTPANDDPFDGTDDNAPFGGDMSNASIQTTKAPEIRSTFLDSIKWVGSLQTDKHGEATIPIQLPDNLSKWKIIAWVRTPDLKVGQTTSSFICTKELAILPNTPRFLVAGDEATTSAIIRNRTDKPMKLKVSLDLKNSCIVSSSPHTQEIDIDAKGQKLVTWHLSAKTSGTASMVMKAIEEQYSDAIEITYPILMNGARVCNQKSDILFPDTKESSITIEIPKEKQEGSAALSLNISPSLSLMMVNTIPYLTYYEYDCSEQTANRIGPAIQVIQTLDRLGYKTQDVLIQLQKKAQQSDVDDQYIQHLTKLQKNPIFNELILKDMINSSINRLRSLQHSNGGWSWFDKASSPDPLITVYIAEALDPIKNNKAITDMKESAQCFLQDEVKKSVKLLKNGDKFRNANNKKQKDIKSYQLLASNWDALLYSTLDDKTDEETEELEAYLWRDRYELGIFAQLKLANNYAKEGKQEKVADLMPLFTQYLKQDEASQLAWLHISDPTWWNWDCNKIAIQAEFLNLLVQTAPQGSEQEKIMVRVAKWLAENRSYGNYWESTRTTGQVINALSAYCLRTKEGMETMSVDVYMDGKLLKTITSTPETIFDYDSTITLTPEQLKSGTYNLEFKRKEGKGNIYASAQWEYFSLESPIPATGNQAVIERAYYRLIPQGLNEKPKRELLKWGDSVNQGDVIDVTLTLNTKNDIKFLMVRDPLPAGFANTELLSTYDWKQGAFKELDVEETRWFYENLPQGKRQINYQLRAQRTGKFSALPSVIEAMYAPQLRGNSREDEIKVNESNQ